MTLPLTTAAAAATTDKRTPSPAKGEMRGDSALLCPLRKVRVLLDRCHVGITGGLVGHRRWLDSSWRCRLIHGCVTLSIDIGLRRLVFPLFAVPFLSPFFAHDQRKAKVAGEAMYGNEVLVAAAAVVRLEWTALYQTLVHGLSLGQQLKIEVVRLLHMDVQQMGLRSRLVVGRF